MHISFHDDGTHSYWQAYDKRGSAASLAGHPWSEKPHVAAGPSDPGQVPSCARATLARPAGCVRPGESSAAASPNRCAGSWHLRLLWLVDGVTVMRPCWQEGRSSIKEGPTVEVQGGSAAGNTRIPIPRPSWFLPARLLNHGGGPCIGRRLPHYVCTPTTWYDRIRWAGGGCCGAVLCSVRLRPVL